MAPLNPSAAPWVPSSSTRAQSQPISVPSSQAEVPLPDDLYTETEYGVSPVELEELEAVDEWVQMMAEIEGMEQDHLIEMSLRLADPKKLAQVKAAALSSKGGKHHRGGKHHKHSSAAAAPKA